jgi:hypothetical protein
MRILLCQQINKAPFVNRNVAPQQGSVLNGAVEASEANATARLATQQTDDQKGLVLGKSGRSADDGSSVLDAALGTPAEGTSAVGRTAVVSDGQQGNNGGGQSLDAAYAEVVAVGSSSPLSGSFEGVAASNGQQDGVQQLQWHTVYASEVAAVGGQPLSLRSTFEGVSAMPPENVDPTQNKS